MSLASSVYTVTEGVDELAEVTLVRNGGTGIYTAVTVTTIPVSATGKFSDLQLFTNS